MLPVLSDIWINRLLVRADYSIVDGSVFDRIWGDGTWQNSEEDFQLTLVEPASHDDTRRLYVESIKPTRSSSSYSAAAAARHRRTTVDSSPFAHKFITAGGYVLPQLAAWSWLVGYRQVSWLSHKHHNEYLLFMATDATRHSFIVLNVRFRSGIDGYSKDSNGHLSQLMFPSDNL